MLGWRRCDGGRDVVVGNVGLDFVVSSDEFSACKKGLFIRYSVACEVPTEAETVEGGSRDNARSTILFTAPAFAKASYL